VYVYFLKAWGECPLIKIGSSRDPQHRLRQLQTGCPFRLKLLGTIRCTSDAHAKTVERRAHNIFYKQRRRGEWFRLSQSHEAQIMAVIRQCADN